MKKLKANQRGPWCSFCEPKTERAVYRENGFAGKFACSEHKSALAEHEKREVEREEHLTEADYQTWMRL
ncbi:hypothetical protein KUL118_01100 [Tenacibaculum sp. KUL118]|nr:hypothetical protein KUL118_01100 [Tenacibaculum sp. KUL118]